MVSPGLFSNCLALISSRTAMVAASGRNGRLAFVHRGPMMGSSGSSGQYFGSARRAHLPCRVSSPREPSYETTKPSIEAIDGPRHVVLLSRYSSLSGEPFTAIFNEIVLESNGGIPYEDGVRAIVIPTAKFAGQPFLFYAGGCSNAIPSHSASHRCRP